MNKQHGFSLIEALIALLVLSFGLMGVAAMQLKALQSATAGYQRSVATLAAVDAQERLWAELAKGVDCSNMTDNIESDWQEDWFDGSTTPIRDSSGTISLDDNCEFKITITLDLVPDDADGDFTYVFRLPN